MATEMTDIEKERGRFMIMWREDIEMLKKNISDEERRVIVEALFDWFLGQEMALSGLLGMVLGNLVEKQKRNMAFCNLKREAGRKGAEKRWGKNSKRMADDSKRMAESVLPSSCHMAENSPKPKPKPNNTVSNETVNGVADGNARFTAEAIVAQKRTPPSLDKVLEIARHLGIDLNWAREFYADMEADNWCFINASGNTAVVNILNVGGVMRKRHKWATEKKQGKPNQPKGVNLTDDDYDFSKFNEGN